MEYNLDTTIKDLYDWGQISVVRLGANLSSYC